MLNLTDYSMLLTPCVYVSIKPLLYKIKKKNQISDKRRSRWDSLNIKHTVNKQCIAP